ncbi:hypothetical protein IQ254_22665 [Nodosilinea sp. LEGE 07088]|uniref:hypothetical protein n=1 Tax=Nodosilinea sp. LEGE 07088 TaxID=2777968 RepID=UPI001882CD35|nr:hypothetical protein [Nodosilinea sp. LEGE 07088]MBE9139963.1 hypothetical protein [Nodosilinea sp. LEGE 07088]
MVIPCRLVIGLITVIAWAFTLWAPMALAQTNAASSAVESSRSTSRQDQPVIQESPSLDAPAPPQAEASAVSPALPPAQPQRGKTYEQPPDPYNMEAIEAYDEEIYGSGR